ncbi:hypothetical protein SLS57_011987 [Botryosphaeria dothidea]
MDACSNTYRSPVEQQNDRSDYTRSISIAESRKVLQKLFDQMNEDFMFLKTKCRLHGDRIMSRWKKRSREKRELWLLQADPNLCVDRWHLLRYVCMDAHLPWENARKLRKNFLLPYLSVDVLKNDPALFLSLLYNRTYYHPYMWAPSDSMELATGWNLCYLDVEISGACVAMYRENYGSLVAWDAQAAHRSDIVPFPRAKLIFEAQACLLRFLRDVVNQILGEADIHFKAFNTTEGYYYVLRRLCDDAVTAWFWKSVLDELTNAKNWHDRPKDQSTPGLPLPPEYDQALGALEVLLYSRMQEQTRHLLPRMIFQRPGFSHKWDFQPAAGGDELSFNRRSSVELADTMDEDPLEWCLIMLVAKPENQPLRFDNGSLSQTVLLFNFLANHLAQCSAKERERLDEVLLTHLQDHATISTILLCLCLNRPQNTRRRADQVQREDDRFAWRSLNKLKGPLPPEVARSLASKLKRFFDVGPLSGPKDQNWLRGLDASHETLQGFWKSFSLAYKDMMVRENLPEEDIQLSLEFLSGHTSKEYLDACAEEREQAIRKAQANRTQGHVAIPDVNQFSAISDLGEPRKNAKREIHEPKAKAKTRGQGLGNREPPLSEPAKDAEDEKKEPDGRLAISNKRTLKVLKAMFPIIGEDASKSIDWGAFVQAMADMGFSAQNNGGSSVVFLNQGQAAGTSGGKIIFHKQHSVPKIDPIMLQSWGKRMMKWFGWRRDRFFLAS